MGTGWDDDCGEFMGELGDDDAPRRGFPRVLAGEVSGIRQIEFAWFFYCCCLTKQEQEDVKDAEVGDTAAANRVNGSRIEARKTMILNAVATTPYYFRTAAMYWLLFCFRTENDRISSKWMVKKGRNTEKLWDGFSGWAASREALIGYIGSWLLPGPPDARSGTRRDAQYSKGRREPLSSEEVMVLFTQKERDFIRNRYSGILENEDRFGLEEVRDEAANVLGEAANRLKRRIKKARHQKTVPIWEDALEDMHRPIFDGLVRQLTAVLKGLVDPFSASVDLPCNYVDSYLDCKRRGELNLEVRDYVRSHTNMVRRAARGDSSEMIASALFGSVSNVPDVRRHLRYIDLAKLAVTGMAIERIEEWLDSYYPEYAESGRSHDEVRARVKDLERCESKLVQARLIECRRYWVAIREEVREEAEKADVV